MWSYITHLSVGDNVYHIFAMLVPWMLLCGYIKRGVSWSYTGSVAAFTPVVINLGRLPYADKKPAGDYALLRIEENLVGISIGAILTIIIFPVFAIDRLKENIKLALITCKNSIKTVHIIYDQLLLLRTNNTTTTIQIDIDKQLKLGAFLASQHSIFQSLIDVQRILVGEASVEPTFWLKSFSKSQYKTLIQQQIDVFRMLHNIDTSLVCISGTCSSIEYLQQVGLIPKLHSEISQITQQLSDCLDLWIEYFSLSQTICNCKHKRRKTDNIEECQSRKYNKIHPDDYVREHKERLILLHAGVQQLHEQHQLSLNQLVTALYETKMENDQVVLLHTIINDEIDTVIIALQSLFYSMTHLINVVILLGTSIHTILELETTNTYKTY